MKQQEKLRQIVYTGVFAALICMLTMLHIPVGNGYIHLGDSLIYVAACMLPMPYGVIAAAIGGGMSDIMSGYAIYALPTLIIKSLLSLTFYGLGAQKPATLYNKRSGGASVLCVLITVVGYAITGRILYGSNAAAIETIPGNLMQGIGSAILFFVFAMALSRVKRPIIRR